MWNITCKWAELILKHTFFSLLWLSPGFPVEVGRITTVSVDLFIAESTGTWPGSSCEVQHVDVLPGFSLYPHAKSAPCSGFITSHLHKMLTAQMQR